MKRLIADKYLRGANRIADPGDEFECSDAEAAGLVAAEAAHVVGPVVERAVEEPEVEKAVDEPERVTAAEAVKRAKPRKRKAKKVSG